MFANIGEQAVKFQSSRSLRTATDGDMGKLSQAIEFQSSRSLRTATSHPAGQIGRIPISILAVLADRDNSKPLEKDAKY